MDVIRRSLGEFSQASNVDWRDCFEEALLHEMEGLEASLTILWESIVASMGRGGGAPAGRDYSAWARVRTMRGGRPHSGDLTAALSIAFVQAKRTNSELTEFL